MNISTMTTSSTSPTMEVNTNRVLLPFPILLLLLLNVTLSNVRLINSELIDTKPNNNHKDIMDSILMKRSSTQREETNDDYMHSQLMKDLEMRLYQNQQQQMNNDNQYQHIQQNSPSLIQQRQFTSNGLQSGYHGEPGVMSSGGGGGAGRLPFVNSLYPYLGSKFLSLFPRKSFQLNPYNPFPFLPNLLPHFTMPYSSQTYTNPWSWGTNPYFSPSYLNNYNSFSSYNNRFSSHQPEMVASSSSTNEFNHNYNNENTNKNIFGYY